jgi:trans-2,3-dihydro-3-hydroxyanthranilate isomerase
VIAELKNRSALSAAQPRADVFARHLPATMTAGVYLYIQAVDESADIQARMFGPLHGIPEDPATGGAGVVLIGLLAHLQQQREMDLSKRIGQGADMGRPSLLEALAQKRGGAVTATFIGGRCAPMIEGTLNLQ